MQRALLAGMAVVIGSVVMASVPAGAATPQVWAAQHTTRLVWIAKDISAILNAGSGKGTTRAQCARLENDDLPLLGDSPPAAWEPAVDDLFLGAAGCVNAFRKGAKFSKATVSELDNGAKKLDGALALVTSGTS